MVPAPAAASRGAGLPCPSTRIRVVGRPPSPRPGGATAQESARPTRPGSRRPAARLVAHASQPRRPSTAARQAGPRCLYRSWRPSADVPRQRPRADPRAGRPWRLHSRPRRAPPDSEPPPRPGGTRPAAAATATVAPARARPRNHAPSHTGACTGSHPRFRFPASGSARGSRAPAKPAARRRRALATPGSGIMCGPDARDHGVQGPGSRGRCQESRAAAPASRIWPAAGRPGHPALRHWQACRVPPGIRHTAEVAPRAWPAPSPAQAHGAPGWGRRIVDAGLAPAPARRSRGSRASNLVHFVQGVMYRVVPIHTQYTQAVVQQVTIPDHRVIQRNSEVQVPDVQVCQPECRGPVEGSRCAAAALHDGLAT